jgi:hypothetical protein
MQSRRVFQASLLAATVLCALALAGCGKKFDPSIIGTFRMGERIQIGSMTYTVLEAQYKPALTDAGTGKPPKDRYLFIRVSVTNGGGEVVGIPPFGLTGPKGDHHAEITEGLEDVQNHLGVLRMLPPAQTEQGWVIFDAPIAAYRLLISDGGEPGSEKFARVDIPAVLE